MHKKNINYILTVCILSVIISFGLPLTKNIQFEKWTLLMTFLIFVTCISQMIAMCSIDIKRIWLLALWHLSLYVFYLSHIVLYAIGYDFKNTRPNLAFVRYGIEDAMNSAIFSYICINMVFIGIIITNIFIKCDKLKQFIKSKLINKQFTGISPIKVGYLFIIVSLPIYIHKIFTSIYLTINYGYSIAAETGYNYYLSFFAQLLVPGLLILVSASEKKQSRIWFCFGELLFIISMLSGQRAYYLMYAMALFYVFLKKQDIVKIRFRSIVFIGIGCYIIIILLNAIRNVRETGMGLKMLLTSITSHNTPIMDMLNECGITSNVICYTMQQVEKPFYFTQLFSSLLICIPGVSKILPNVDFSQLNVTDRLDAWNLGGALVADVYFDFGVFGALICILIGILMSKLLVSFVDVVNKNKTLMIAWYVPVVCEFAFWTRSTFYKIPRNCFFYTILYVLVIMVSILISKLFSKVNKK